MTAYYNENDPYCVQWLRNLIAADLIAPGDVDDRSIADVRPADVAGYRQCHWFAGIGGWSLAARLAGWDDDRELWTGSCPCQPFSAAGKRKGTADSRHLWPEFARLIAECRPAVVAGEQVASKDGRLWLAGVRADLEALGYAVGAGDLCAAGVSAPHARQRLYWVANPDKDTWDQWRLGNTSQIEVRRNVRGTSELRGVVNADGYHEHWWSGPVQVGWNGCQAKIERSGREYNAQWRLKPGVPIVAHGVSDRVAKLCAIGNAIVPQVAAEFLNAYMECRP